MALGGDIRGNSRAGSGWVGMADAVTLRRLIVAFCAMFWLAMIVLVLL